MYKYLAFTLPIVFTAVLFTVDTSEKTKSQRTSPAANMNTTQASIKTLSNVVISTNQLAGSGKDILFEQIIATDGIFPNQRALEEQSPNDKPAVKKMSLTPQNSSKSREGKSKKQKPIIDEDKPKKENKQKQIKPPKSSGQAEEKAIKRPKPSVKQDRPMKAKPPVNQGKAEKDKEDTKAINSKKSGVPAEEKANKPPKPPDNQEKTKKEKKRRSQ
ncbi:hypothetical protein [Fictibacillus terranigra]|uniref:YqxM protein n=1 Tax=Fictibacillus terranigra TaxID=3058424 RepID=A0ABT8E4M6_9BACL|nr:hypothetical protein [Fictibacillus sp. CENA-BCM004]MDN4072841.1 hypothetical protein [Fictibacillus sp. CENA-BCM004]